GDDHVGRRLVGRPQGRRPRAADDLEVGLLLGEGPEPLADEHPAVDQEQLDDVLAGIRARAEAARADERRFVTSDSHGSPPSVRAVHPQLSPLITRWLVSLVSGPLLAPPRPGGHRVRTVLERFGLEHPHVPQRAYRRNHANLAPAFLRIRVVLLPSRLLLVSERTR